MEHPSENSQHKTPGLPPFWRRVLHRWLIEYNPLYLLSATLVLAGVIIASRGLAQEGTLFGEIGVAAIAELYAFALIGGAALLTRIQLRRPAVLLALLAVLYQGDLTLHTETCLYLGAAGGAAAAGWLLLFVGKLYALAWALRLRLSHSAVAVPILGALGLVLVPRTFALVSVPTRSAIVACWLFALFAAGLWTSRRVAGRVALERDKQTIANRTLVAAWSLLSLLALGHVFFWTIEYRLEVLVLCPVAMLLATRWIEREKWVWCLTAGTLLFTGLALPQYFSLIALLSSAVLCLHALRKPYVREPEGNQRSTPYRTNTETPLAPSEVEVAFAPATRELLARLLTGALLCGYLSYWTRSWSGGAWPQHLWALDLVLAVALTLLFWRGRVRLTVLPALALGLHWGVQTQLVALPNTEFQWGACLVGIGFFLLLASLGASWLLQKRFNNSNPESAFPAPG